MLLACNKSLNLSVCCPLDTARAGWDCGSLSASHFDFDFRKGITILFKYWIIDTSLDQWLEVCDTSQPSGNVTAISFALIQNLWMHKATCQSSSQNNSYLSLSLGPLIATFLLLYFSIVQSSTGSKWIPVWSQLKSAHLVCHS